MTLLTIILRGWQVALKNPVPDRPDHLLWPAMYWVKQDYIQPTQGKEITR